MRLVQVKDAGNLGVFKDIVDLQVVDKNVEAVVVKHNGQELRITSGGAYSNSVKLLIDEPKEEVVRYRVKGTYMGLDVNKEFDDEYDAKNYIIEMNGKLPYNESPHTLEVEKFSTFVNSTKI